MKGLRTLVVALLLVAATGTVWAQWQPLAPIPYPYAANSGSALTLGAGGTLYACFGGTNKFYRYVIATNTWDQRANLPIATGTFGPGAALASNKNGWIYALLGTCGNKRELWRYWASDNSWLRYADIPADVNEGGALAYAYECNQTGTPVAAWLYATIGGTSNRFFRFGPVTLPGQAETRDIRYWLELAPLPVILRDTWQAYPGACLAWWWRAEPDQDSIICIPCDPNNGTEPSDSRRTVLAYSPSSNTWRLSLQLPVWGGKAGPGAAISSFYSRPSLVNELGCLHGDTPNSIRKKEAWHRDVGTDWEGFDDTPQEQGMGAAIASGDDYWFYAFFGQGQTGFYRHYFVPDAEGGTQSQERTAHEGYSLAVLPNPIGPRSVISFTLPARSNCRLMLCDATGRVAGTLADQVLAAGCHSIAWSGLGTKLAPGVYVLRLETGSSAATTKVIVR